MYRAVFIRCTTTLTCCHSFHSLSLVVPLVVTRRHSLSFVVTPYHSLSLVIPIVVTRCHSLSLVLPLVVTRCTTRYHSLSLVIPLVVTRCHSLSLVLPLVVTRCTTLCHSFLLVVTRYTTRLSVYKRSMNNVSIPSSRRDNKKAFFIIMEELSLKLIKKT